MTIFYPDISNHQDGLILEPGTVAVCAKATEGSTFTDPTYADFRSQAASIGAFFFAYHWLHRGKIEEQADLCARVVGTTPVMIDYEEPEDPPPLSDCLAFAAALRARGVPCHLVYLPDWYWDGKLGGPSLAPLVEAGLHLVSSEYTDYSDTGPGWTPYGGMTPEIWQYTSTQQYGGKPVDFDAFRGTLAELQALVTGQPGGGTPTGLDAAASFAAGNADGRLEFFVPAGGVAHRWQLTPNGGWSGWASLGGHADGLVAIGNADGRLEVFGTDPDGTVVHSWQLTPNGGWSGWASLGGQAEGLTAARNADGRIELFGTDPDGSIVHSWQLTPNGGWSGWASFSSPR